MHHMIDHALKRAKHLGPSVELDVGNCWDIENPELPNSLKINRSGGGSLFGCADINPLLPPGKSATMNIKGSGCSIFIGENFKTRFSHFIVEGTDSTIIIGPNCRLLDVTIKVVGSGAIVIIGGGTTWEGGAMLNNANDGTSKTIIVGNDCMLSSDVNLRTADGHSMWQAGGQERIDKSGDIVIGNHVWLGNGSRVARGSRIGNGAVLGQRSFLSATMEPFTAYAGVPARKVRDRVEWSRTTSYDDIPERYRWKEMDDSENC